MSKVTVTKKNRTDEVVLNYPDLNKKQSLQRVKEYIREVIMERIKKRPYGWTYKVK